MFSRSILTLTAMLLAVAVHAQHTFTVTGRVKDIPDGEVVGLYLNDGTLLIPRTQDTIRNGTFRLTDSIGPETGLYALRGLGENFPSLWLDVWAKPGAKINVDANGYLIRTWEVNSALPEQQEAGRFIKPNAHNWDRWQQLLIAQRQLNKKRAMAKGDEKQALNAARDSLNAAADKAFTRISETELAIMRQLPVTDLWFEKLKRYAMDTKYNEANTTRGTTVALYNSLPEKQRKTREGREIAAYLFPPKVVKNGEPMADTAMVDLAGKQHKLADYKGKYLLLDFWSVGCGPCLEAMPELKTIADSLRSTLTVISLNIDIKRSVWKKYSEKEKITWVNLNDDWGLAGLAARYGVNDIPHYVMISPNGTVIDHWIGYREGRLKEKVKQHLH